MEPLSHQKDSSQLKEKLLEESPNTFIQLMVDNMAKMEGYTEEWDEMAMEEVTLSFKIVDLISMLENITVWKWAEEHKIMCCVQKVVTKLTTILKGID